MVDGYPHHITLVRDPSKRDQGSASQTMFNVLWLTVQFWKANYNGTER